MTGIDVARKVATEHSACLFKQRAGTTPPLYDVKPLFTGNKRGWTILDAFSASAIVAVFDALNENNRTHYGSLHLVKMAKVAFKLVK